MQIRRQSPLLNLLFQSCRLHAICIGPGLGRHKHVFEGVKEIIQEASKANLPIIIDADGLFFINDDLEIISGNHKSLFF